MHLTKRQLAVSVTSLFFVINASPLLAEDAVSPERFVQVETTKLRAAPQAWARPVADLRFGDRVSVDSIASGWVAARLSNPDAQGYVHESAVTERKVVLKSVAASLDDLSVDQSDVYLAGKGFNGATEGLLAKQDSSLSYEAVNRMVGEARSTEKDIAAFISSGMLEP